MIEHDATNAETTTVPPAMQPVEFIDAWLQENAAWIDSRVMDFALDLRTMLSVDDPSPVPEREPVGVDA